MALIVYTFALTVALIASLASALTMVLIAYTFSLALIAVPCPYCKSDPSDTFSFHPRERSCPSRGRCHPLSARRWTARCSKTSKQQVLTFSGPTIPQGACGEFLSALHLQPVSCRAFPRFLSVCRVHRHVASCVFGVGRAEDCGSVGGFPAVIVGATSWRNGGAIAAVEVSRRPPAA